MIKVKIKALDAFSHGALLAAPGGEYSINKGDADELVKAGFVELVSETDESQTGVTDSQEDLDDLVGGKAEDAPENKMEAAPANKGKKK
jgi:hypothetical protein